MTGSSGSVLERIAGRVPIPEPAYERLLRRRARRRRNQRLAAGSVGIAIFVATIWIATSLGPLDRTQMPVVPGGASTGPAEMGPTVTGSKQAIGPVPETDYLLDLSTGETTPLPESIVGANNDHTGEYAASPDGSKVAYTAPGDNGKSQIFVANLDGTGIEQVTRDLKVAFSPAWSPDGSKIAFAGHRGDTGQEGDAPDDLFVLDLATGTSTQLTFETWDEPDPAAPDHGPWSASEPSFSPDGASIVYNALRNDADGVEGEVEVRIVPTAGGESVRLLGGSAFDAEAIGNAGLSPDGSLLSYSCYGYSAVCIANADGTAGRVLLESFDAPGGGGWSPDGTRFVYSTFHAQDVTIIDVATGEMSYVAEGGGPTWVDDHTLIVEYNQRCYDREAGAWEGPGGVCPG